MSDRLNEIRARLAELQPEILRLSEAETLTEDEERQLPDFLTEWDTLTVEVAPLEERAAKVEEVRKASLNPAARETTEDRSFNVNLNKDPFDLSEVRSIASRVQTMGDNRLTSEGRKAARELVARAATAIEKQESRFAETSYAESATKIVERDARGDIARWVLEHGSDDYHEGFQDYMANPAGGPTQGIAARASMSLTGANGGYMVPFTLDPNIILTNNGATNPFRGISTVKSIVTDDWNGVSSAGVTAEWIAEATEVADGSPTVAQPSITVYKADAYIQASMEVVADASLSGEIGVLIADAKDRLEATAYATGSGSGQPFGIVTALGLTTASRVATNTNAVFGSVDIYALDNDLGARWRENASFVGNKAIFNLVRQMATGSGPQHAFWTDFGGGLPPQLIGYNVYQASAMAASLSAATASTDDILVLGDFRAAYYIVDRMGIELVYNPLVLGSNRRPNGEVAWVAFWRGGGDSVNDAAFRMLRA